MQYTNHKKAYQTELLHLYLMDNMELLKQTPDKFYDLAIVDPPYGLKMGTYRRVRRNAQNNTYDSSSHHRASWDKAVPTEEYFNELFRVSKNQIIWGGNFFGLPSHQCFIFWYKQNPAPNFADGELAWTSFDTPAKCFDYRSFGITQGLTHAEEKIHPTQKPVKLYQWLFHHFAKHGDKILDTHLGSGNIAIAAHYNKLELWGCEVDQTYWDKSIKNIEEKTIQLEMFPC